MAETSVLQSTLDAIIARLASLESKVGIQAPASVSSTPPSGSASTTTAHFVEGEYLPRLTLVRRNELALTLLFTVPQMRTLLH